nr:bifunctional 3-dehydroquinate dehydratase/shikimate dehydrogenase, chloroplastic [Quercus suber]
MVVEVSFFTRVRFTQVLSLTEKVLCLVCQKKIRKERAKALAGAVSGEALLYEGTILANASAVGMEPNTDQTPVSKEALKAYELVFDKAYTPRNTQLLQEVQRFGPLW